MESDRQVSKDEDEILIKHTEENVNQLAKSDLIEDTALQYKTRIEQIRILQYKQSLLTNILKLKEIYNNISTWVDENADSQIESSIDLLGKYLISLVSNFCEA